MARPPGSKLSRSRHSFFVGSRSIALWHTLKIEDQLQQQQQETWQRYFPQIKRTHNFRFYFKQQLAQQYPEAVPLLYHYKHFCWNTLNCS